MSGGICFDCRELCEEDDENSRFAGFGHPSIANDNRVTFARVRGRKSDGEDSSGAFEETVLRIIYY